MIRHGNDKKVEEANSDVSISPHPSYPCFKSCPGIQVRFNYFHLNCTVRLIIPSSHNSPSNGHHFEFPSFIRGYAFVPDIYRGIPSSFHLHSLHPNRPFYSPTSHSPLCAPLRSPAPPRIPSDFNHQWQRAYEFETGSTFRA